MNVQVFILGKTKTGKSSLAKILKDFNYIIYEAGSWVRQEYAEIYGDSFDEFSPEFKDNLTQYALSKLKTDCCYSIKKYDRFVESNVGNKVIVGVRNPDDFFHMLQKENSLVIFINSEKQFDGKLELFETGLKIIKDYINWKNMLGIPINVVEFDQSEIENVEYVKSLLKGKL